ncbi:MAG TPA: hypothetical protein VE967_03225 [Gemmatimonadaceae bacterium]|nr:hypothetical protein [Gemmatimonadaceae bacterium]
MPRIPNRSALVLAAALIAACSNSAVDVKDPDPPANVAGTFKGPFTSQRAAGTTYAATAVIDQNGRTLTGTFTATDNSGVAQIEGTVDKQRINATFRTSGTCPATITAVIDAVTNDTVLVGTYTAQDCIGSYTGGFSLTKQG